ncbi:MAG: DUF2513 domain-containing protein [Alphaproteobacteria bacterium]
MSRDKKLMQKIMLYLEQQPQGKHIHTSAIPLEGYTHQQIASHVRLLAEDEGLLDITRTGTMSNADAALVLRITNAGYDFLEAAKQSTKSITVKAITDFVLSPAMTGVKNGITHWVTIGVIALLGSLLVWIGAK